MKIMVDILGGDNAPLAPLEGCKRALLARADLEIVALGEKAGIEAFFKQEPELLKRIEIIECVGAVTNSDHPATFLKEKPDCTLAKGVEAFRVRDDIDALVSSGPTGAILTGTVLRLGRIPGIARPALLSTFPTKSGGMCRLLDTGANMDCKPEYLVQFAQMADIYLKLLGVKNPRIGLLSVGMEEGKGNELVKETFPLLQQSGLNFVGNIEADRAFDDLVDIIVCDGFSGNVFAKAIEGSALYIAGLFKEALTANVFAKFGALFQLSGIKKAKAPFKFAQRACAPLLGAKKLVLKAHGKAGADTMYETVDEACKLVEGKLIESITEAVKKPE